MYQKCPVCNGTGQVQTPYLTTMYAPCDVCEGTKIISEINGLPPSKNVVNAVSTQRVTVDKNGIGELTWGYIGENTNLTKDFGHQIEME